MLVLSVCVHDHVACVYRTVRVQQSLFVSQCIACRLVLCRESFSQQHLELQLCRDRASQVVGLRKVMVIYVV